MLGVWGPWLKKKNVIVLFAEKKSANKKTETTMACVGNVGMTS